MSRRQLWVIAAAGLVFALVLGVRQSPPRPAFAT
jgi:hypothetical protein